MINMTPYDITFRNTNGEDIIFPASGKVIKIKAITRDINPIEGISCQVVTSKILLGIPEVDDVCIVTPKVLEVARELGYGNMIAPAKVIKNDIGHIIAVTKFSAI